MPALQTRAQVSVRVPAGADQGQAQVPAVHAAMWAVRAFSHTTTLMQASVGEDLCIGGLAGAAAAAATTPLDVVKTVMMCSASSRPTIISAGRKVFAEGGGTNRCQTHISPDQSWPICHQHSVCMLSGGHSAVQLAAPLVTRCIHAWCTSKAWLTRGSDGGVYRCQVIPHRCGAPGAEQWAQRGIFFCFFELLKQVGSCHLMALVQPSAACISWRQYLSASSCKQSLPACDEDLAC